MTDQDKITAILNAIQNDTVLMSFMRLMVTNNLSNVSSDQLDAMMHALGLS